MAGLMEESGLEDYDVLGQLAKGGQATTSRVRRKRDGSVWVMKESYVDNTRAGNSALREAKTLQSLNHPYINRYQDVFLHQQGGQLVVATVMEYCEGGDLAHYLIAYKRHTMIVDPDRALRWMQQMCSAIAYLHAHKVVHRDLKPQNIFMMTEDSLRVGDFGLAQTIERGKRTSQVGTPCYMAPEVLHHDAYAETVDVWGLGCIMLEAVTLEFLWERKGMLAAHVVTEPVQASSMSPEYPTILRDSISKCLIHAPAKRPTAAMLEGVLHSAVDATGDQDQSGLAQVFGNLATQWTSWLTPSPPAKPSLGLIAEEMPEHALLSQMPDTVPHRPEGRPIPLSEQREIARRAAAGGAGLAGGGLDAGGAGARGGLAVIGEAGTGGTGGTESRGTAASALGALPPASGGGMRKTPAQLQAEVSMLLTAAQHSGRLPGDGAGAGAGRGGGLAGLGGGHAGLAQSAGMGAPAIDPAALALLGVTSSSRDHSRGGAGGGSAREEGARHRDSQIRDPRLSRGVEAGRSGYNAARVAAAEGDESSSSGEEMEEMADGSLRPVRQGLQGMDYDRCHATCCLYVRLSAQDASNRS